jgi:hypothetical protein
MKKTIIIIGVILGIVAMALGVYFARKKTKSILTPPSVSPLTAEYGLQPTTAGQLAIAKLKILSDQPIFDYFVRRSLGEGGLGNSTSASEIFYLNQDGLLFKVKEDGKNEAIISEPIENLQTIKSSSDGKRALIKFGDLVSPKFTIFNSQAKIFELLPENITAAAFSPDVKKIAYLETPDGNSVISNLVIKDLVDSKPKISKILSFNQKDFDLEWILPEKIVLVPKPSAFYQASAWIVDTKKKTLTSLGTEVNGLMIKWSANGKMGLQFSSQSKGRESRLNLINEQGLVQAGLDFVTLPGKCLISDPKIYCAVPTSIPAKTVLPDDYLKRTLYFRDAIYQIDINQNSLSEIFTEAEPAIDAVRLNLFNNKLLFINRYDNKLYQLEL